MALKTTEVLTGMASARLGLESRGAGAMGEMLRWRRRGNAWPPDVRVFPDGKRYFSGGKSVECLGFQTRRSKNSREISAWAFLLEKRPGNPLVFMLPNWP
jgi:hypothetical protein